MNTLSKILTITASAFLLAPSHNSFAESNGEYAEGTSEEAVGSPEIRLVNTPGSESVKVTVAYTSHCYDSEERAQELYGLLQRASREACGSGTMRSGGTVTMKSSHLRCYRNALSNAVKQIDSELLTRLHAG